MYKSHFLWFILFLYCNKYIPFVTLNRANQKIFIIYSPFMSVKTSKRKYLEKCFCFFIYTMKVNGVQNWVKSVEFHVVLFWNPLTFFVWTKTVHQKKSEEESQQKWNHMRVSKWWQHFNFFVWTVPLASLQLPLSFLFTLMIVFSFSIYFSSSSHGHGG